MEKFSNVAIDPAGNAISSVTITVYEAGTLTLASLFSDNGVTAKANPHLNEADGSILFYATNGRYDIVLTKTGFTFDPDQTSDVILFDPTDATQTSFGGHLFGLTLANNTTDATNDIDIAIGEAVSDDTVLADRSLMSLTSAFTKQLDVAWAAGTAAGGRISTEALANGTWHVFLFQRSGGQIDICFSQSLTPTLPDSGTKKRRIGSILRESAVIVPFIQTGDNFLRKTPVLTINVSNPGTSAVTRILAVPLTINVQALISLLSGGGASPCHTYLSSLDQADIAASTGISSMLNDAGQFSEGMYTIKTDAAGSIRSRLSFSDASSTLQIGDHGWIDSRGRDV